MTAERGRRFDPGLARERTELAWNRTAISFAALGGAVLKTAPGVGLLILAVSALVYRLGRAPFPAGSAARQGRRGAHLLITVAVTLVAAAALVAIFTSDGLFPA